MVWMSDKALPVPNKDILSWMFDEVDYDQDKPIYIDAADPSRFISNRQARTLIRKLIAGFRAAGLRKGDPVCLHAFNDIYYSIVFLAVVGAGGIYTGTNPAYTSFELTHHIKTAHVKMIISEGGLLPGIQIAADKCNIPRSKIFIFNTYGDPVPQGFRSWEWLMQQGEQDWVRFDDEQSSANTEAARLFSSGTTGLPKAAMLTHRNFVAQYVGHEGSNPKPFPIVRLYCLPMFHAATCPTAHTATLKGGFTAYVMRRFEMEPFFQVCERYQLTELFPLVPPVVIAIIVSPFAKKYSLRSIKSITIGAAPLDKGPQARLAALCHPEAMITQVWGMTETSCVATRFTWPEIDTEGAVGYPISNVSIKLVHDSGAEVAEPNTPGEICIRGPTVFKGYLNNPEANRTSFDAEGFFHTGDIGYIDGKSNKWFIIDRKKELLKVRGFQVAPMEIEAVLLQHPDIVDAAVVGIKYGRDESELPRAYVVRRPETGKSLNEEEVRRYVKERLASYKQLDGGLRFVDAIPKTASGKILKRLLREEAAKEINEERSKL